MSFQNPENKSFKILALDGGGMRGVVTLQILEKVQELIGKDQPFNEYFDIIAGTSTGAIIAAGLAIGKKTEELKKIYQERGYEIFHSSCKRDLPQEVQTLLPGPKYSNEGLIKVLREELKPQGVDQEITLGEVNNISSAELLIFAYDTFHRNTTFFTSKGEPNRWFNNMKLWEVCTSSASAPTFFPPYEFTWIDPKCPEKGELKFTHVDGGVGANCPEIAALSHAMLRGATLENISLLSIGTGRTTKPITYEAMKDWGSLGWATKIPDIFMGSQAQISTDACKQIFKAINPDGYLRLQFDINEAFEERGSLCEPEQLIAPQEQKNKWINDNINEEIDNINEKNIDNLLKAADIFASAQKEEMQNFIDHIKKSQDKFSQEQLEGEQQKELLANLFQ